MVGVCFVNIEIFFSQWVPITDWQQLRNEGRCWFLSFFKASRGAPIKSNSIGCPVDVWIVFTKPIRSKEDVVIAGVGNKKVCKFRMSGAHFYL